jgi:hypothetical protein
MLGSLEPGGFAVIAGIPQSTSCRFETRDAARA